MASRGKVFIGIDPGTRNIGVAVWPGWFTKRAKTQWLLAAGVTPAIEILSAHLKALTTNWDVQAVGVEDYGSFGARVGSFGILKVIGAVLGICVSHDIPVLTFMPAEKVRASSKVTRPVGMSDHEFDALCIAHLTKEAYTMRKDGSSRA